MKRKAILLLLPLSLSAVAYGAEIDSTRNYNVDEVVVTATRSPLPIKNTPVITRVINSVDIARRGMPSIQNILEKELAGVEFHQAGYGSTLSFQGLDARYVLFLVDGERIAGETYGNIDYSRIPVGNIEKIEIVRGASSVMYGSNAMGAIVNIITKMPKKKAEVNGSFRYGTPFQNNGSGALAQGAPKDHLNTYRSRIDLPNTTSNLNVGFNLGKFRSLTTATYTTTDAYKLVGTKSEKRFYPTADIMEVKLIQNPVSGVMIPRVTNSAVENLEMEVAPDTSGLSVSGYRTISIGQRFDYRLSDKFRFEVSGNYYNKNRYDFHNNIMVENIMAPLYDYDKRPWTYENDEGYMVKALMEHSPNENHKVYLTYVRDEYYRRLGSLVADNYTPKQRHTYNIPRLLWTANVGSWNRFTSGVEWTNEQVRLEEKLNPNGGYDKPYSLNTISMFVQDEIMTGRKLSFTAGVRGDHNDKFGWNATPNVSAKLTFNHCSLRANYAMGYRNPNLKEMYMYFKVPMGGTTDTYIAGNNNLKPETNQYLSIAAEYLTPTTNFSVTLFHTKFRNKIDVRGRVETDPETNKSKTVLQYENINRSELSGVEVMLRVRPFKGFMVRGNYNYIFQNDDAPQESTQYIYPSPHTAILSAEYGFGIKQSYLNIDATVRYVGAKDYKDFMNYVEFKNPPIQMGNATVMMPSKMISGSYSSHHDGYAICSLTANLEFRRYIALAVGVDNLFDYRADVVNFNSAMTPRRNFFTRVSFAF